MKINTFIKFQLVFIIYFIILNISVFAKNGSIEYMTPKSSAFLYKTKNVYTALPIKKINSGDVVKIVKVENNMAYVKYSSEQYGWVKYSKLKHLDNNRTKMMNELEIIDDIKDIEPIFLLGDIDSITGERKVHYIDRSFMTPEFLVNLDKEQFEREVYLYYKKNN